MALLLAPLVLADEYGDEHKDEYEAGYTSLAVAGVAMIEVGVAYYALTKRKLIVTHKKSAEWGFEIKMGHPYMTVAGPMSPMTVHYFFTITGTLLVFLHVFSCGNYTGIAGTTGLAMAVVLVLLNATGFIGRAINRGIISAVMGGDMERAREYISWYEKWKKLHILLVIVFAVLLAIHLNVVD